MAISYLPVSWQQYHQYAQTLAQNILTKADPIDGIVAIARGGLSLGHVLSDFLSATISTFAIQSYENIQEQGEVKVTAGIQTSIEGKHVLVVDDVADTGKTFLRSLNYLTDFKPKKITTAAMFYKPGSAFKPDFVAQETSKWILFPTEVVESILAISKHMKQEGTSDEKIATFLLSLNYTRQQIDFVRRFHIK